MCIHVNTVCMGGMRDTRDTRILRDTKEYQDMHASITSKKILCLSNQLHHVKKIEKEDYERWLQSVILQNHEQTVRRIQKNQKTKQRMENLSDL